MTGKRPLVSAIIPVYNCELYLAEAIESVLAQTYRPIEIIMVDDGSTDGTADVAKRYATVVRYVRQPNSGAPAARNRGAELAQGDFLSFLDADDTWVEDKLERQMACFDGDQELDVVCGHVQHFISPDVQEELEAKVRCPERPMPGPGLVTMLVHREAFQRVGPLDTRLRIGESLNWWARAMEQRVKTLMLPDVVQARRIHLNNISIRGSDARSDYLAIVRESLNRRRSSGAITCGNPDEPRQG